MPSTNKSAQASPFEIITTGKSKKVGKTGIIVGIAIVLFLVLSVVAGILLVRQQQNVSEKAATCNEACPNSSQPNLLQSCHPADSDGSANESLCNLAKRVETCGASYTKYCCPSAGGSWTTNMTACATAKPAATATATAAPTATPTMTATPTPAAGQNSCNGTCGSNSNCQSGLYCYSGYCRNPLCASDSSCGCGSATTTPTPTAAGATTTTTTQTTPRPVPVTGTDWPTVAGIGVGAAAIVVSVILAL